MPHKDKKRKKGLRLVMAGGGTGGHLFPAIALAEEFKKRDPDCEITFVGGKGGLEEKIIPRYGYSLILQDIEGIKRRKGLKLIKAVLKAVKSTIDALGVIRSIRPDGVIGSGSYSSAPVVLAGRLFGVKTAILEQNALPGLTNRVLGKVVNRIYIAFEEARGFFPGGRTILSGNPVRKGILKPSVDMAVERSEKFSILVFGGSQGATAINAAFLDATEYLTDIWGGLRVVHQTGEEGFESVKAAYKRKNLKVELSKFIEDMGEAYASADLVVCRAGATSIAEISALGIASILIPYPFASDDHQTVNARCLSSSGAAIMIKQDKLTGSILAESIRKLYERPGELKAIRDRVSGFGRPKAAEAIAENFLKLFN